MSNRFFVEGCITFAFILVGVTYGVLPFIVGAISVMVGRFVIEKMEKEDFIDDLDRRLAKWLGMRK